MKLKPLTTTLSFISALTLLLLSAGTAFSAEPGPPKSTPVVATFRNCTANCDSGEPDRVRSNVSTFVNKQNGAQAYITSDGTFLLVTGQGQEIIYDLSAAACVSCPSGNIFLHGAANLKVTGGLLSMTVGEVRAGEAGFNLTSGRNHYLLRFYLPTQDGYGDTLPVAVKRLSLDSWEIEAPTVPTMLNGETAWDKAKLESYRNSYSDRVPIGVYYAPFKITLTRLN